MARIMTDEQLAQLDQLPRQGAMILTHDGTPTWAYDPAYFLTIIERAGLEPAEVEKRAGWSPGYFSRKFGLRPGKAGRPTTRVITYDSAERLTRALDLHPVDVGV